MSRGDLGEFSNIDNAICGNYDCTVLDRRAIHCRHNTGTNDHSLFTTFRHAATKRLHGSWQSSGTVARIVWSVVVFAKADSSSSTGAWTWSQVGSNFSFGNRVDAIAPP